MRMKQKNNVRVWYRQLVSSTGGHTLRKQCNYFEVNAGMLKYFSFKYASLISVPNLSVSVQFRQTII